MHFRGSEGYEDEFVGSQAMAAMVAQQGVTGQSLVEQFSSGNLNPWVGGYANNSLALPWAPVPEGLKNNPFDEQYVGDVGFDPLGFAKNKRLLPWYREAELAHGRVCMMAVLGFTVQISGAKIEPFITRFPTDSADPLKAATQVPIVGWLQILAVITLSELWRYENVISKYDAGVKPGDLGWNVEAPVSGPRPKWFGPTFTSKYSKEEFGEMKLREIKHARLAMIGFAFMVVENACTGKGVSLIPFFEKPEYAGMPQCKRNPNWNASSFRGTLSNFSTLGFLLRELFLCEAAVAPSSRQACRILRTAVYQVLTF